MAKPARTNRVFIASPGDLAVERRAFKDVLDELNAGFGDGLNITFEALGWEDTLASTGRRSLSVIAPYITCSFATGRVLAVRPLGLPCQTVSLGLNRPTF